MEKIGEGYYYNVYKIVNDQVIKFVKHKIRIFIFIACANRFHYKNTMLEYKRVVEKIARLEADYAQIFHRVKDKQIFANPIFINAVEYRQDFVKDLRGIDSLSAEEFRATVIDYTFLLKELWSWGVSDAIFNFSLNCGYDRKGKLVLMDFNEVTCNKDEVREHIAAEIWLARSSYLRLGKEKQDIFRKIMHEEISETHLDAHWLSRGGKYLRSTVGAGGV